jgi:hypothetical protein
VLKEITMQDLKQIGPRIREDVYEALQKYSETSRMSMSLLVELALKDLLTDAGYSFDDRRY